jgi:cytidylate kinase
MWPAAVVSNSRSARRHRTASDDFIAVHVPGCSARLSTPIPILTIDGPSGSGKGTVARQVANALQWHLLDSGALYRLTAFAAQEAGLPLDDEPAVARIAGSLDIRFAMDERGEEQIWLGGQEVSALIRTETAGEGASKVAAMTRVRAALLQRQRDFARTPGLVADGRDMGTVVFPDADLKIFLTATAEERAARRYKQLKGKGLGVSLAALSLEIAERDRRDSSRPVSPLKPAADAVLVDSTSMTIDEVVEHVLGLAQSRWPQADLTNSNGKR